MSKLEDDISRAMAAHDDEAPRPTDLLRALEQASAPRHQPGWYVPFMVAAAVAAVVAGSVWAGGLLGGHKQAPVSGGAIPVQRLLSCPASYAHQAPWVPTHAHLRLPAPGLGAQPAADPALDPRLFRHARPFRGLRDFLLLP